jgi:hypothetical protein
VQIMVKNSIIENLENSKKLTIRKYLRNNKKLVNKLFLGKAYEATVQRKIQRAKKFAKEIAELGKNKPKDMWKFFKDRVQTKENEMEDFIFLGKNIEETRESII